MKMIPWVTFDSVASAGGTCAKGAEPDIAGAGVVLSFIIASVMATTASVLAMLLDRAFDSKGHFSLHAPIKGIREKFLDTEWKRDYAWRPFLDPLIISLGDQQLITGYCVLLTGWIKVAQHSFTVQGAHFVLILYVCALSSSSHLAALITLRKYFTKYKLIAKIRLSVVVSFAVSLLISMIAALGVSPTQVTLENGETGHRSRTQRLSFLLPLSLILIGFSIALACILYNPKRSEPSSRTSWSSSNSRQPILPRVTTDPKQAAQGIKASARWSLDMIRRVCVNPMIAFTVQILLAMLSAVLVLSQKYAPPPDHRYCGLQDPAENSWGFGQILSIFMLLLPAISAGQTYLEGRREISECFSRPKD